MLLLLLGQRYNFESKSQQRPPYPVAVYRCCCQDKDTILKANHNCIHFVGLIIKLLLLGQRYNFESKSQRCVPATETCLSCCCQDKDTILKANHNTTVAGNSFSRLLLLGQRYNFESKSQLRYLGSYDSTSCCCQDKDTILKANHNCTQEGYHGVGAVAVRTKIQF